MGSINAKLAQLEGNNKKYMLRALELASKGKGWVSPNPMVGAVVVRDGKIIGEGWHKKYGEAHAEVNALKDLSGEDLRNSTLYVTLEPCNHFGKTPPCCDLILEKRVPKVVIATKDPNPKVSGSGLKRLEKAGVEVIVGILENEAKDQNRVFFNAQKNKRPFITLKWAKSLDGFIAGKNGKPIKISNSQTDIQMHNLRAEVDAILIGNNTLKNDNPRLDVRLVDGKTPTRIVLGSHLRVDDSKHFFRDGEFILLETQSKLDESIHPNQGLIFDLEDPKKPLKKLLDRGIQHLLVEGGQQTLSYFIQNKLWDEAIEITGNLTISEGIEAPALNVEPYLNKNVRSDQLLMFKASPSI